MLNITVLSIWEAADIRHSLDINTSLLLAPYNDKCLTFQDSQPILSATSDYKVITSFVNLFQHYLQHCRHTSLRTTTYFSNSSSQSPVNICHVVVKLCVINVIHDNTTNHIRELLY